jgi:hypothetical protein
MRTTNSPMARGERQVVAPLTMTEPGQVHRDQVHVPIHHPLGRNMLIPAEDGLPASRTDASRVAVVLQLDLQRSASRGPQPCGTEYYSIELRTRAHR